MKKEKLKPCPSCDSKAIRDDKITKGVEGAVRRSECSFCALITDWQGDRLNKSIKGKKEESMPEPIDTQIVEETLSALRGYYGYDTLIGRDNLHEYLSLLCIDHAKMTEKLACIKRILDE
jgi:hypothetical protein